MQNIIIDLNNPKSWFKDFSCLLKKNNLELPSYDSLCKWQSYDYNLSKNDLKLFNFIKENNVILYHGCKTFETNSFYEKGLLIPDRKFYYALFMKYIEKLNIEFLDVYNVKLRKLISEKKLENRNFALLVPHSFQKECSSFVGFGCEWITPLFLQLFGENAYDMLLSIGKPTVFKIEMPLFELDNDVCKYVCGEILKCFLDTKKDYFYTDSGAVIIHKNIPPNYIVSHFYIEKFYSYHTHRYVTMNEK